MYYEGDRYTILALTFLLLTLVISIVYSCVGYGTIIKEKECLIVDILNITIPNNGYDIFFLVNTSDDKTDLAYGTSYYEIGRRYKCIELFSILVLGDSLRNFLYVLISSATVLMILLLFSFYRCITIFASYRNFYHRIE